MQRAASSAHSSRASWGSLPRNKNLQKCKKEQKRIIIEARKASVLQVGAIPRTQQIIGNFITLTTEVNHANGNPGFLQDGGRGWYTLNLYSVPYIK